MERNIPDTSAGVSAVARLLLLASACITSGCLGLHGGHEYSVAGRILDSSEGRPLAGLRLAVVTDDRFRPAEELAVWPGWRQTDADGRFEALVLDGYSTTFMLLGLIPLNLPPPVGPPLDEVRVYVEKEGVWRSKKIRLDRESQTKVVKGRRYIQIGDIVVEPAAEQVGNSDANHFVNSPCKRATTYD